MYQRIIIFLRGLSVVGCFIFLGVAFSSYNEMTTAILCFASFLCAFFFFDSRIKSLKLKEFEQQITGYCKMASGYKKDNDELVDVLDEQDELIKELQKNFKKEFQDNKNVVIDLDDERNKNNALRSAIHSKECAIKELEKENQKLKNGNEELNKKIASNAEYIKKLSSAFKRFSKLYDYDSPKRHSASLSYMFTEIGWNNWQRSVHEKKEQIDRYHRAKKEPIKLLSYDDVEGKAIIKGTSGKNYLVTKTSCSCPDFDNKQRNNGPCKHMYYLAMQLYNHKLTKGSE